jgi:hypothetical protein
MLQGTAESLVTFVLGGAGEAADEGSLLHQVWAGVRLELEGEFTGDAAEEVYVRQTTPPHVAACKRGRWRTFSMQEVALHLLANTDGACYMLPFTFPITAAEWQATQQAPTKRARCAEE